MVTVLVVVSVHPLSVVETNDMSWLIILVVFSGNVTVSSKSVGFTIDMEN